jgi:hypothetical protein
MGLCRGGGQNLERLDMAAEHGTISRYRGSRTNPPCRCAQCKSGWATYMRNRRSKSMPERTKTRKLKTDGVVVPIAKRSSYPPQQPAASPYQQPAAIGPNEQAVIDRLAEFKCEDVALIARCRTVASILDDKANGFAAWVSAARQLDTMMVRFEGGRKSKSRGRLAAIVAMQGGERHRTTGT